MCASVTTELRVVLTSHPDSQSHDIQVLAMGEDGTVELVYELAGVDWRSSSAVAAWSLAALICGHEEEFNEALRRHSSSHEHAWPDAAEAAYDTAMKVLQW